MRKINLSSLLLILLLACSFSAKSQKEAWAIESSHSAIAVDNEGNLLAVDGNTLTKFDTSGNIIWTDAYGASISNLAGAIDGSIFIIGMFGSPITLGTETLDPNGTSRTFIAKLNSSGAVQWANQMDSLRQAQISIDTKDNVYVGGRHMNGLAYFKFSLDGTMLLSKTLNVSTGEAYQMINFSTDMQDNYHINFYALPYTILYMGPPDYKSYYLEYRSRVIYDSIGNIVIAGQLGLGPRSVNRGYKARANQNDYVSSYYHRPLSGKVSIFHTPYTHSCMPYSDCLNGIPINVDYDRFGGVYYAGVYPEIYQPCSYTNEVKICNNIYNVVNKDIYVIMNYKPATTTNCGNTDETATWIVSDLNGRSLYVLGSWSKIADDSQFKFGSSTLTNPGGMILRYSDYSSRPAHYFRTVSSGNWSDPATWESSTDNMIFYSATIPPSIGASGITIQNNHTIVLSNDLTVDAMVVMPGGNIQVAEGKTITIRK